MQLDEEFNYISNKIEDYKKNNIAIPKNFYVRQFEIANEINDSFEKNIKDENTYSYSMTIRYNMTLKYLAEKIGKPVEEYKEKIKENVRKLSGRDISDEEMDIKDI